MQSGRSSAVPGKNGGAGYAGGGSYVPTARAGRTTLARRLGFAGTCNTTLIDWIQLVQLGNRDAVLTVRSGRGRRATLWCRRGNIIDASCDGFVGEDAVYRVLAWPNGEVSLNFGAVDHRCAIDTPTTGLLIEAMVRKDEAGHQDSEADNPSQAHAILPVAPARAALAQARRRRREWMVWAAGMALALALLGAAISKKRSPAGPSGRAAQGVPAGITVVPLGAPTVGLANAAGASSLRRPIEPAPHRPAAVVIPMRQAPPMVPARPAKRPSLSRTEPRNAAAPSADVPPPGKRQPNIQIIDDRQPQVRIVDEHEAHVDVVE